jgi:hypothetical protein
MHSVTYDFSSTLRENKIYALQNAFSDTIILPWTVYRIMLLRFIKLQE